MTNTQANTVLRQNWATNIQFQAEKYACPETLEQLQESVQVASKVRVIGTGHSFNDIADTDGTLISLSKLDKTVTFDHENQTATVPAGMTHVELVPILHQAGYALSNMASIPFVTVIGACVTATHGSGNQHGNLATQVAGLEIVNAAGEVVSVSRATHGERFNGMVVALGGLGVVTKVTLDVVPAFEMQQQIYLNMPLTTMEKQFDEIMAAGYSVSLFTHWRNKIVDKLWVKQVLPGGQALPVPPTQFEATLAETDIGPAGTVPSDLLTTQHGVPGPWYERLPHFHIRGTMTGQDERQTEYFVARDKAVEALMVVESLSDQMATCLKVSEVRSVAADKLWLSTAYRQDCIGIHFSWYAKPEVVNRFLPILEAHLMPFQVRPHWGKMFTLPPDYVRAQYTRMSDFEALLAEFDPQGKFCNPYLARYVHRK
ncbi:MAG: FAD-binding protein [Chloroflexota bacterium]